MNTEFIFTLFDLVGTFVFALSGAQAAKERGLDLFGIVMIAFLTACGGGIIRDICIGATPPVGLSYWPYLALTIFATICIVLFYKQVEKMNYPVLLFDALGLSMFCVTGTQKTLHLGFNYEVAILLGTLSAIGGGMLRDTLLKEVPVTLRKEIYGSAALIGSCIVALAYYFETPHHIGAWLGLSASFIIRYVSMKNKWDLPKFE